MSSLAINIRSLTDNAFTVRGVVSAFGKLCLIAAVGLAYEAGNAWRGALRLKLPSLDFGNITDAVEGKPQSSFESYGIITARNIFGSAAATTTENAPKVSQLKLRLVGTNVSVGSAPFAIIEETQKGDQDVFEVNDTIFEQAKLVEILPESVRIQHNNKIETLLLEEDGGGVSGSGDEDGAVAEEDGGSEFTVAEDELNQALGNLPLLLSQARAVPYFQNGQSVGMRLFAIRRGSMYERLGLKNGDIVKSINDNNLSDPSQALKLFEQLKSERSIYVTLERNGEERDMRYTIR